MTLRVLFFPNWLKWKFSISFWDAKPSERENDERTKRSKLREWVGGKRREGPPIESSCGAPFHLARLRRAPQRRTRRAVFRCTKTDTESVKGANLQVHNQYCASCWISRGARVCSARARVTSWQHRPCVTYLRALSWWSKKWMLPKKYKKLLHYLIIKYN